MSAPTLTRRYPLPSTIAGAPQEFYANVVVLQTLSQNWNRSEYKPRFSGRGKWWDGSAPHEIFCRPMTLGISKRNIITLGAGMHRRDPIIMIHIFSRDVGAIDVMTEEVDRIIKDFGVNPAPGIQYILPSQIPSQTLDEKEDDDAGVLFHNVVYVEVLYYKNKA